MTKHLAILVSPEGEEFYEAYGPMTKLRDQATRFDSAQTAIGAANQRYGRHSMAFWNSERASRDQSEVRYRGWTARIENVDDGDIRRTGHYLTSYAPDASDGDRLYAVLDGRGQVSWSGDLGRSSLWQERSDALEFSASLAIALGRKLAVTAY